MAVIVLNPGEEFEHRHQSVSTSTLLVGDVDIAIENQTVTMLRTVPVTVPSGSHHVLVNVGTTAAVVECLHKREEKPPGDVAL